MVAPSRSNSSFGSEAVRWMTITLSGWETNISLEYVTPSSEKLVLVIALSRSKVRV